MCKCGNPNPPGQRYCNPCSAAYMREWRKTHPLTDEQRWKENCRSYSRMLEIRGHITPTPCEGCGCEKVQRHHEDYDNPRWVIYLCKQCHKWLHELYEEFGIIRGTPYESSFYYARINS